MTKKELSQLYWLNREIEEQQRRLSELESLATSCTNLITGMPRGTDVSDTMAKYTAEIADLRELLNLNIRKCFYELNRLNRYISTLEDSLMRQILSLRYVNGLTWKQIAGSVGGGNTEDSVRMIHNRFLSGN